MVSLFHLVKPYSFATQFAAANLQNVASQLLVIWDFGNWFWYTKTRSFALSARQSRVKYVRIDSRTAIAPELFEGKMIGDPKVRFCDPKICIWQGGILEMSSSSPNSCLASSIIIQKTQWSVLMPEWSVWKPAMTDFDACQFMVGFCGPEICCFCLLDLKM